MTRTEYQRLSLVFGAMCFFGFSQFCCAEIPEDTSKTIVKIAAGTPVQGDAAPGWSHVLLMANSRLSQGNTEKVSETVKSYVTMFSFVMMAHVQPKPQPTGVPRFELNRVGVGLATETDRGLTVVSGSPRDGQAAPQLSFMSGQVLKKMEASFDEMRVVARHPTLLVMDSNAIVYDGQQHADRVLRNVIWTNPERGGVGSVMWLLKPGPGGQLQPDGEEAVFLPPGFKEDRELHVDASQFTLGIPGPKAFALIRLPNGRPFRMHPQFATVSSLPRFDASQLKELGAQMMVAMAPLQ